MKKLLVISALLSLLFPLVISAQAGPPECVKLKRDIKFEGSGCDKKRQTALETTDDICPKDSVVGEKGGSCPIIKYICPTALSNWPENQSGVSCSTASWQSANELAPSQDAAFGTLDKTKIALVNLKDPVDLSASAYFFPTAKWGIIALINVINTVVDWVFTILVVLAVLFVLLGAYNYLTSAGSPEKTKTGRNYILYATIGLAVAFIARAIPSLVKGIMGY